jgi:hypothetical protein
MSSGFDEAQTHRNWLEQLGEKIPGFQGFQDRELRREVDKMQREYLSAETLRLKNSVRDQAQRFTDAGQIGTLSLFDRLDRKLDGLSQAFRFCDYGATGFFDVVKIGDEELGKLYDFDLSVLSDIASLENEIRGIPTPGDGDPREALGKSIEGVSELEEKWAGRRTVISDVVQHLDT